MNIVDTYLFGLRSFFWLFFPAVLLVVPALLALLLRWRRYSDSVKFLICLPILQVPIFAYAVRFNLQERYHYLHNMLLLITVGFLSFDGILFAWRKWGTKLLAGRGLRIVALTVFVGYFAAEYLPLYLHLPDYENASSSTVIYDGDRCNGDQVRCFFGLVKRSSIVTFSSLSYRNRFPYCSTQGRVSTTCRRLNTIRASLRWPYFPMDLPNNPSYCNWNSLLLMFIEKFGSLPPDSIRTRAQMYISLSFPPNSPFSSTAYSGYECKSDQKAQEAWRDLEEKHGLKTVLAESTPEYRLLIGTAEHD
jgi:hypothetical protein